MTYKSKGRKRSRSVPYDFFRAAMAALKKEAELLGVRVSVYRKKPNWRSVREGFSAPSMVTGAYYPAQKFLSVRITGNPGRGWILKVFSHELEHARQHATGEYPFYFTVEGDDTTRIGAYVKGAVLDKEAVSYFSKGEEEILQGIEDSILAELAADAAAEETMEKLGLSAHYRLGQAQHTLGEAYPVEEIGIAWLARRAAPLLTGEARGVAEAVAASYERAGVALDEVARGIVKVSEGGRPPNYRRKLLEIARATRPWEEKPEGDLA